MKITWSDIQNTASKLMFLEESEIIQYADAFIDAANDAMIEIAASAAPINKSCDIVQFLPENTIKNSGFFKVYQYTGDDLIFNGERAKAYSFYASGNGSCHIETARGELIERIEFASGREFILYRGIIDSNDPVRLRFSGEYLFDVKGAALYKDRFSDNPNDIVGYDVYIPYDIAQLSETKDSDHNFMGFNAEYPVLRINSGEFSALDIADYKIENHRVLKLPRYLKGEFGVFYNVYPKKITADTPGDYIMEFGPRASRLIPFLMAWRLLKESDERKATIYFNEYQLAKRELVQKAAGDAQVRSSADIWNGRGFYEFI